MSIFHSKRPRKFWGFIFSKTFFLQYSLEFERIFFEFLSKFSNEIVKKAFYVSRGTLWKKHYVDSVKQFGTLGDKRFDLRRKICSTVVKSSLFVSRWASGRIVLKEILLFLFFFRTSREHFLVFSLYHSRHGGPNWIPQAKRNISIRKNFVRKLFVLSGLWARFLNIHWSLFGMLSKLQFTCS